MKEKQTNGLYQLATLSNESLKQNKKITQTDG